MNSAKPPRLAAWILQHFGPELNQEALAGDLNEAFQQGRSKAWYWRQALVAVRWRRLLFVLLLWIGMSWWFTSPETWHHAPLVSRPLDIGVFIAVFLAISYLQGTLRGWLRAALAVLIVIFFVWLDLYHYELADHYAILVGVSVMSLIFYRKKLPPPPYHLTLRELLLGDQIAERQRMIARLEQTMMQETDPELRQAYAESIAAIRRNLPPRAKAVE